MKAFLKRFRGDDHREKEHREKSLPPPPPSKVKTDDFWLNKHTSAPPASFSLPHTMPSLPPTPNTAPPSKASTPARAPSPPPAPPVAAPQPAPPVAASAPAPTAAPAPTPTPASAARTTQRQPSPPPPATHSTASSRPSQSEHSRPSQSEFTSPESAARRKVAFQSPAAPVAPLPEPDSASRVASPAMSQQPQTTSTTYYKMRPTSAAARFAAQHRSSPERTGSSSTTPPRISTSAASGRATGRTTHSPTQSTRTVANDQASMTIRSGTPYSHMSGVSAIQAAASWSEAAENDLVNNLGPRERTRQEVLWEIVASEERYVGELIKLKETFIDPLLHPFAPVAHTPSLYHPADTTTILDDDRTSLRRAASPAESLDHLPIAARFLTSTPGPASTSTHTRAETPRYKTQTPTIGDADSYDSDDEDKFGGLSKRRGPTPSGGRSPYGTAAQRRNGSGKVPVPFPARSHQSLPPQPRGAASTHSLGGQSFVAESTERDRKGAASALKRFQRRVGSNNTRGESASGVGVTAQQLPEDLRICLEVLEDVILPGHLTLREELQKRYEEQYPLVRSLADIFVSHSNILLGYAKYVLHLERALGQVDNALASASVTKRPRNQDAAQWTQVCKALQRLEEVAADKCETGLAISLSKPFQRLLKYPLLFQNLLFHTDPSTYEYESTLQMVAEVERIVRSIEDEKTQKEERDRTWDVFARIEGLEKVKQLAVPKPSRLLLTEKPLNPDPTTPETNRTLPPTTNPSPLSKNVKGKSSFKRLSDVLQPSSGVGGKKDLWLVTFNDVVLRCQRTGTTTLPLVSGAGGTKLPEPSGGKADKYATSGRRAAQVRPRNMYKFIQIETWAFGGVAKPRAGIVSMEDIGRSRNSGNNGPIIMPVRDPDEKDEDDQDGAESDESDRKSKMSFSYWGADKITVQPTARGPTGGRVPVRRLPGAPSSFMRDARTESSANAKFGTRLRESSLGGGERQESRASDRPGSRQTASRVAGKRSDKPAWGALNTTSGSGVGAAGAPSVRRGSSALAAPSATTPQHQRISKTATASPAPSVDSGIAVYLAQDSTARLDRV